MEQRIDLKGRPYYWLGGKMDKPLNDQGSDHTSMLENYISVTPLHYDKTDYRMLPELEKWDFASSGNPG